MESKYSYPKNKIKIVLSEKIDETARITFQEAGYGVEEIPHALDGDSLMKLSDSAHVLGVRSRSKITDQFLAKAKRLLCVGCFTVGTDQVELLPAQRCGIPVFNAPHSSTRSVAELTVACMISLSRRLGDQNRSMHDGTWQKSAIGSREIRDKTIGIVGYGHIGQQVGLLAESLGMNVLFYDVVKKLPLGRSKSVSSLNDLLSRVDFLSLHVPGTPESEEMIGEKELSIMKKGSYLINHSRGKVVKMVALREALLSGQIGGSAIDVFPSEPESNTAPFESEVRGLPNVILSSHIGGSTEEAQKNIGIEVAKALIEFLDSGSTAGAVNFPNINLPILKNSHRIINIHKNLPGALSEVNQVISEVGANIDAQYLSTASDIGYLIMDINKEVSEEVKERIAALPKSIKTRMLF
ncbi:MAG TPA: phosphoglycerate dehydrogenase [Oligoflexia bacterium]|nr:phosphoglycerate dehydrogenase [Oligoflexia bacterium]HMP48045.1 phosphoglycerate dehydrogenase [Oligoflexia bacterium]